MSIGHLAGALTRLCDAQQANFNANAVQVEGGWILNGRKRWIGNATFADIIVYWARNTTTGEINAFILRKGMEGLRTSKIENKISLRCVQNANIFLDDCFVPDSDRLTGVNSFKVSPPPIWSQPPPPPNPPTPTDCSAPLWIDQGDVENACFSSSSLECSLHQGRKG